MSAPNRPRRPSSWVPTPAHLRAVVMAAGCSIIAAVAQRIDIAVLGVPFLVAASAGWIARPRRTPSARLGVDSTTLFEGQATTVRLTADSSSEWTGELVTAVLATPPWLQLVPGPGGLALATRPGTTSVEFPMRAIRWGLHDVDLAQLTWTSAFGAYRTTHASMPPVHVVTLPLGGRFTAADALPRPAGLVGLHRSRAQGSGSELSEVRPFVPGDRLRRINWRITSRTGALHVNATWTDRDTEVVLLLDTEHDFGRSDGIDGRASSLDTAVRATAAIAEHYLHAGDRVGVIDLGRRVRDVPVDGGRHHLRHILDVLVAAQPGRVRERDDRHLARVRPGSLVIALSPLLGAIGTGRIAALAQHGHTIVIIDTLPDDPFTSDSAWRALAVRVRLLERREEIARFADLGVPTVRWRGRGTLDEVLRDVGRLAAAPRIRSGAR